MIVAQQKKKENIAEYLLYMWQVEDLIRVNHFDTDEIRRTLVDAYEQPEDVKRQILQWYEELAVMMRTEGVVESGHVQLNKNTLLQLSDLHLQLLKAPDEMVYGALYYKTLPFIIQLRSKSGGAEMSELETCFTAVYGYLMLRMQQKEISPDTLDAIKHIHAFLSFLAEKYREMKWM